MKREYNMTITKKLSKVRMMNSKIQKEEKELARMRSKKMAAEVIAAQEKVVGDLKKQQEMLAKVEGGALVVMYILKESVHQDRDARLMPSD